MFQGLEYFSIIVYFSIGISAPFTVTLIFDRCIYNLCFICLLEHVARCTLCILCPCFGPSRSALSVHFTAQNFWRRIKGLPTLLSGAMESCNWKACKSQSADATTALVPLSAWLQSSATPGLNMCLGFWCAARQTELETPLSAAHAVSKDHQTRAAAQSKQTEEGPFYYWSLNVCDHRHFYIWCL